MTAKKEAQSKGNKDLAHMRETIMGLEKTNSDAGLKHALNQALDRINELEQQE